MNSLALGSFPLEQGLRLSSLALPLFVSFCVRELSIRTRIKTYVAFNKLKSCNVRELSIRTRIKTSYSADIIYTICVRELSIRTRIKTKFS